MFMIPPTVQIFLARQPTDMRKPFDGLAEMVRQHMDGDPLSGHLFVFVNRRGDRVKILYWDRSGYTLYYKRLEAGRFHLPHPKDSTLQIPPAELTLMLEGIDLSTARRRKRFDLEKHRRECRATG